jgi:hypothetical protein
VGTELPQQPVGEAEGGEPASSSDFRHLDGTSITFLSMVAAICTLLSAEEEQKFMAELNRAIKEPTLCNITALVRDIRPRLECLDTTARA